MNDKKINTLENLEQPDSESLSVVEAKVIKPQECYNCGHTFEIADYYLVVKDCNDNQFLYDDVCCEVKPTDEIYEFEICPKCGAAL